ncbi:MAG: DUF5694 domain-containing protein [Halopenitus sp.]
MTTNKNPKNVPKGWPCCESEQVRVMLLGTYHMDNPGLDEVNVDADDVLADDRQAELRELVDDLAEWEPHRVAVERPYDRDEEVNNRFKEYQSGEREYDREETFPAPHPRRNERNSECRSEVVQVGFRLADRLDHDYVPAVDEHPKESRYDPDPFENRDIDSNRKTALTVEDRETTKAEGDEQLESSTIPEYLAWVNGESNLRKNHDMMFDRGIREVDEPFGSPIALAYWYERNIRIVHHLWRTMNADDDRIVLLIGSGHIRVLRHLLEESPMFCPVSPLPYLPNSA